MAYDVDFWYQSQDACQITSDFTPFSDDDQESIFMKSEDFFTMIDEYSDTNMMYDAWRMLKEQVDQNALDIIKKIEEDFSIDVDKFYKEMREKQLWRI